MVKKLQTGLNEGRGSFAPNSNPVLAVDGIVGPATWAAHGIFGPHTETAVKGAQRLGNIAADGIVGQW